LRKTKVKRTESIAAGTGMMAPLLISAAHADDQRRGATRNDTLTMTNLTLGQDLSPPVLVTHAHYVRIFARGDAASDALAIVGEDGDGQPPAALASTLPEVAAAHRLDVAVSCERRHAP
jgi:hypothetical protein